MLKNPSKTFLAKAINGKLDYGSDFNLARLHDALKSTEGKTWRIEYVETKRTLSQNSLYWLFLQVIERETGQPAQEVHEWAKRMFLPPKFITVQKKELKIPASTTQLSKHEMGEYLDRISADVGISVPDPRGAGYFVG
jgi:hypothetical protein